MPVGNPGPQRPTAGRPGRVNRNMSAAPLASTMEASGRTEQRRFAPLPIAVVEKPGSGHLLRCCPKLGPCSAEAYGGGRLPAVVTAAKGRSHTMSLRPGVLVGRQAEKAALQEALAAARRGQGCAVFLVGEPGIGKSRLAAEVTEPAAAAGVAVLRGRAASVGAAVPFRPLSEALHSVLRDGPPQDPTLQPYWPVLARFDPGLSGQEAEPAAQSLVLRAEALLRLLGALGRSSGSILLLEDLHDADAETLAVVDYLVDNLAGTPVLLLATLRPDPGSALDAVTAATTRRMARTVPLGRLTAAETIELAADRLGTDAAQVPPEVVTRLNRDADGVPFVVEELLSAMVESGRLVRRASSWTVDRSVVSEIPATVTAAILQRTSRLDAGSVALLEAAAVLGRRFPAPVAASIVGIEPTEVFALLRTAVRSEFIVPDPS